MCVFVVVAPSVVVCCQCVGMTASAFANLAKFSFHYIDSQMEGGMFESFDSCFFLLANADV